MGLHNGVYFQADIPIGALFQDCKGTMHIFPRIHAYIEVFWTDKTSLLQTGIHLMHTV